MLLTRNENYWRHGIMGPKEAQKPRAVQDMTPIEQAIRTLKSVEALRDEITQLEARLLGDDAPEAGPKVAYGEPVSLLARIERSSEDAEYALAQTRDKIRRINLALFGE